MNDQSSQRPADDATHAGNPNRAFLAVAIVFFAVGVSFLANPSMTTVGWVFLPLGVVFLALGFSPAPKGEAGDGDAPPSRD